MTTHTKEPQYQSHIEMAEQLGLAKLPIRASVMWRTDPRLLVFTLSRYKFYHSRRIDFSRLAMEHRPSRKHLEWHRRQKFVGSL